MFGPAAIMTFLVVLVIALIPYIFYLITLQNCLKKIQPHNRKMEPGLVWLMLIPLFNLVWNFIMVGHIADSLRDEFRERGITSQEQRPAYGIGLANSICSACGIVPILNYLAGLGNLVLWIIYWVQINKYSQQLGQLTYAGGHQPLDSTGSGVYQASVSSQKSSSSQGNNATYNGPAADNEDF